MQNYIDNTGVQVADVVVGFHFLEKKTPADVAALMDPAKSRFDYVCWDLYARTSQYYKDHPETLAWRARRCMPSKRAKANWPNWRIW